MCYLARIRPVGRSRRRWVDNKDVWVLGFNTRLDESKPARSRTPARKVGSSNDANASGSDRASPPPQE